MLKNVKKVIISSLTAAALFSGSASLIANADVNDNQQPAQSQTDSQSSSQDDDNSTISIKLPKGTNNSSYKSLLKEATSHLHTPYVYGASGPKAFDCSGFTKYVFAHSLGITLPRTAQAQYNQNQKVSAANAKKGDLVFFGSSASSISHVGIYLGNGRMIDAQNRGVIKESINSSWWHLVGFARAN